MTSRAPSPTDSEMGGGSPPSPPPIHAPLPYRPGALDLSHTPSAFLPPSRPTSTAPSSPHLLMRPPRGSQRVSVHGWTAVRNPPKPLPRPPFHSGLIDNESTSTILSKWVDDEFFVRLTHFLRKDQPSNKDVLLLLLSSMTQLSNAWPATGTQHAGP
ncbi:hypothetical protein PCASD_25895 [Puccinia coronata f. sp. avenae]|uniref:Uncharacterized protein n=1 Tax=Puccinia coronata f. sp. avenae TaxID=200324 RepID=A0A2N5TH56_9BASI|nr:hypothetical protein PCASD_25895 [Puccinia coronata f. sp. avenae]